MEPLATASPPDGSIGALLRAFRNRACLSQEQLAARSELSERTVRNLEAGRVRSPRTDTMRLLADALELTEPERESWFAAGRAANGYWAEPALPGASGPAQLPSDAQRPLSACGCDMGSEPRGRSFTMEFGGEAACEFAAREGPWHALPFGQPGTVDDETADIFGRLLRWHRRRAGLTQKELGGLSGVSPRTIWDLERGRTRRPRCGTVDALARALALDDPPTRPLTVAMLTGDAQDAPCPGMTCLIGQASEIMLAVQCVPLAAARYPARHPGCLVLVSSHHQFASAYAAGTPGRQARCPGTPGHRDSALPQPADGGLSPLQGVPETPRHLRRQARSGHPRVLTCWPPGDIAYP
jgi:transcriptional regulator with XRE-family HTH domain